MLKLFSSSSGRRQFSSSLLRLATAESPSAHSLHAPSYRHSANSSTALRASFCSHSSIHGEAKARSVAEGADSGKAKSQTVLGLTLGKRPLLPGFWYQADIMEPCLLDGLHYIKDQGRKDILCATFLAKGDTENDPNAIYSESGELLGRYTEDVLNDLHKIGTLAKFSSLLSVEYPFVAGFRRVRITKMVSKCPFAVKVDLLEDKPYDDEDALKETSYEVVSALRDALKINFLRFHHMETLSKHSGDFNYSRLADFGAAMSSASKSKIQEVLEELDVHKRLKLTLQLLKKDVEVGKLQESIGRAADEKIRRERKY